jgi:hypothetical protein
MLTNTEIINALIEEITAGDKHGSLFDTRRYSFMGV